MAEKPAPRNVTLFKVFMSKDVDKPLLDVLHSGYITQGTKVDEFEAQLRKWFGTDYCLTVNAGTSALHIALRLLQRPDPQRNWPGFQDGDEVLCTALTCTASNWPVLANGLRIRWVDADPKTANMDIDDLARKFSPKTKAVLFVHWGGTPLDLDRVEKVLDDAEKRLGFRPWVVEDSAHGIGAEWKGKKIGNHGHTCCFSLQAIKHVTSVDGGILILANQEHYERAKLLRWYGIDREKRATVGVTRAKDFRLENPVHEWGYKMHMNDVNATIGAVNFRHADEILARCRDNAAWYRKELAGLPGIVHLDVPEGAVSSWWLYSLRVEHKQEFMDYMKEQGVMTSQVHARNDNHPCVSEFVAPLPQLDALEKELVCIPVGWWVTDEDRAYVTHHVKAFVGGARATPE
eukprot:TRINITY_DN70623_c0_g1_i1.p1 TRINITY_DN70623_c0_g1~~TRINITY_DN70623_c0_g1_i1.p1  ORF type:complete len:404 (+),score=97.06 TRINITY_DN70623_c0_g1_i1:80-1291(+)